MVSVEIKCVLSAYAQVRSAYAQVRSAYVLTNLQG